jgi:hypothetical protein
MYATGCPVAFFILKHSVTINLSVKINSIQEGYFATAPSSLLKLSILAPSLIGETSH